MISIQALATEFPDHKVTNSFFPGIENSKSKMFAGAKERYHMLKGQLAIDLFEKATLKLFDSQNKNIASKKLDCVDAILTNVSLPDHPFTGCGAMLAERLKIVPKIVVDMHNGGCVAYIMLLDLANALAQAHQLKNILICVGQTAAGRIFADETIRLKPQSAIPGDGFCVTLVTPDGPNRVDPIIQRCHPDYAWDMDVKFDDDRKYWEPGNTPGYLDFPPDKLSSIIMRGNRLVPQIMKELLNVAGLKNTEIQGLITNQPNLFFLRNWRESIGLPPEKHFESFTEHANLFQAGIPINLEKALRDEKIKKGDKILLAGFSHAGDYSAAALVNWES